MRSHLLLLLLFAVSCMTEQEEESRLLVLLPFNARSHVDVFSPLVQELAARGHRLDVLTVHASSEWARNPNVTQLVIELGPEAPDIVSNIKYAAFNNPKSSFRGFLDSLFALPSFCEHLYTLEQVRSLARRVRPGQYRAVLIDAFVSECFLPFAHLAEAPLVQVAPSHLMPWNYRAIGSHIDYSQDAIFFLPHTDERSWLERLEARVLVLVSEAVRDWHYLPRLQNVIGRQLSAVLGEERASLVPPVWHVEAERTALVLVNWHWSLGSFVRPNPPGLVEVAGMHCTEPHPLPQDLEEFVRGSGAAGFVLFSLGGTVPGHLMPPRLRTAFLQAFTALHPLRILWKFEEPLEHPLPENVKTVSWLPQQDLLGDERLRVFVTQAGMLSLQQAMWHAKPVIAAPMIVDQHMNAALAHKTGLGLVINLHTATAESIEAAIREVAFNRSYRTVAERLSRVIRDQPDSPRARAAWWVEYVARHGGASHLRSPASWSLWLDVVLPVLVLAALLLGLAALLLRSWCASSLRGAQSSGSHRVKRD